MTIRQLISKSSITIAIILIVIGLIMTGVSFFVQDPPIIAKISSAVVAIIGAAVVFFLIGGLKSKISEPCSVMVQNTRNLTEDLSVRIQDLFEAPEELEKINNNLKKVAGRVQEAIDELEKEKEYHQKDLDMIEEAFNVFISTGDPEPRIMKIAEKLTEYCGFHEYYVFLKDPKANILNRINPLEDELEPLERVYLTESEDNPIISSLKNGSPTLIERFKANDKLRAQEKEWAQSNDLKMVYSLPLNIETAPYGLILFSMKERIQLDKAQNIIISMAKDIIQDIFREEKRVKATIEKYTSYEVENSIYRSLIDVKSFDQLCTNFLLAFSHFIPMDWGGIAVYEEEENAYVLSYLSLNEGIRQLKKCKIQLKGSGISWTKENRGSWVEEDLTVAKPFQEDEIYVVENLKARVITPLYSERRFIGALTVASRTAGVYSRNYVKTIEKIASLLGNVIENSRMLTSLNHTIQELKNSNKELERFYINLAHELKNPANLLAKIAKTVKSKISGMSTKQVEEAFSIIAQNAHQLQNSLESVMDFTRAEMGALDFDPEELYLIEVLKDVLWEFRDQAQEKMISLNWDIPKGMPEIMADRKKLRAIFRELISNAIQHAPVKGKISLKANLIPKSWLQEKATEFFPPGIAENLDTSIDHVLISVTDNGPGISFEKQKSLFKTPREAPEKLEEEEMGMGLPRVKKLVELHQGYIWVASKEGMGTRFSFNLPQYAGRWSALRNMLHERINLSKQSLSSLSVITINFAESEDVKTRLTENQFSILVKEIEQSIKETTRDPQDIVRRFYDGETIIVISQADTEACREIINRLQKQLSNLKSTAVREIPKIKFNSITYPEEVLTADQLLTKLDSMVRGE